MLGEFRLERFLGRWEFEARHYLGASDAESRSLNEILALADGADLEDWGKLSLGYIPSQGSPALRQAIASTYESIQPDQVLCFCGAEEGLYCAMQALLGRDDHAIVTVPNYQAMEELPLSLCGSVSGLTLRWQNQWDLDLDELRSLLRPNTRMVAVNFPNNPTGKVLSPQRWGQLIDIVREHNLWFFSDEVYRGLERDSAHTLAQAADLYPKALSLNVMSKAYGLPGLRVGWIACQDGDLLHRMGNIKDYLSICNSGPSEWLATLALKAGTQLLERNRLLARKNLELWNAFFQNHPELFQWWQPEGSCVAFPRYLGQDGVENWCQNLVQETGVLLIPASIFQSQLGPVDRDRFRLGYGRLNLQPGLQEMGNFLCRQGRPPLLH